MKKINPLRKFAEESRPSPLTAFSIGCFNFVITYFSLFLIWCMGVDLAHVLGLNFLSYFHFIGAYFIIATLRVMLGNNKTIVKDLMYNQSLEEAENQQAKNLRDLLSMTVPFIKFVAILFGFGLFKLVMYLAGVV